MTSTWQNSAERQVFLTLCAIDKQRTVRTIVGAHITPRGFSKEIMRASRFYAAMSAQEHDLEEKRGGAMELKGRQRIKENARQ